MAQQLSDDTEPTADEPQKRSAGWGPVPMKYVGNIFDDDIPGLEEYTARAKAGRDQQEASERDQTKEDDVSKSFDMQSFRQSEVSRFDK